MAALNDWYKLRNPLPANNGLEIISVADVGYQLLEGNVTSDATDAKFSPYTLLGASPTTERRLPAVTASTVKRRIETLLIQQEYLAADQLYRLIRHAYGQSEYKALRHYYWERHRERLLVDIKEQLKNYHFKQADELAQQAASFIAPTQYASLHQAYWQAYKVQSEKQLKALLDAYKFGEADDFASRFGDVIDAAQYRQVRQSAWLRLQKQVLTQVKDLLAIYAFKQADDLAARSRELISPRTYLQCKRDALRQYFMQRFTFEINDEQANALLSSSDQTLVKARAGSGKTRTIVCRAVLAMEQEALSVDQIVLLAFNRKAANEMANRLRQSFGYKQFANARTFHSLAFQLVRPTQELVEDNQAQARVLTEAMRKAKTDIFVRLLMKFVRGADAADLSAEATLNNQEYLAYRRALKNVTLSGVYVKSEGEKWIADYLFEHGILFDYEKVYSWNGRPYRPDFTVRVAESRYVIIEHWGVAAHLKDTDPIFGDNKTAGAYRQEMRDKRQYWLNAEIPLIETSVDDMKQGRGSFEARLASRLAAYGIIGERLSELELQKKLERTHLERLAQMMLQFIQRAKNRQMSPVDIERRLDVMPKQDERTYLFWRLATQVYKAYEDTLKESNRIDFHELLRQATQLVELTKGNCSFELAEPKRSIRMNELRWLLIDEFQDFSPSFDSFIEALRRYNPTVKLFCVGDDWQAINGFAGSDLSYFSTFTQRMGNASELLLQTNQRSRQAIVEVGNQLMVKFGAPGRWRPDHQGGRVCVHHLDTLWLNWNNDPDGDKRFYPAELSYDNGFMATRCLKFCCYVLMQANPKKEKEVAILSRTNQIYGLTHFEFKVALLKQLGQTYENCLTISTVHSYKGSEARLVIVTDVTEGEFPLIHADTGLYAPFFPLGVDPYAEAMAEERRLFYVALTRAEEKLWLLTETNRESQFLKELALPITPIPPHTKTVVRDSKTVLNQWTG